MEIFVELTVSASFVQGINKIHQIQNHTGTNDCKESVQRVTAQNN